MDGFKLHWTNTYFSFCYHWHVSISAFPLLFGIPLDISSSVVGLKICAITAAIIKYKSIIKKKRKKHEKTVLLAKTKLNNIEVSISKSLIDSDNSHDEFVSGNNVFKQYNDMRSNKNIRILIWPLILW